MAAFAVAEHVVSVSPVVPTDVKTNCAPFKPESPTVDVYFHRSAHGVKALARILGTTTSTSPLRGSDPRAFVTASAVVNGIQVRAWTLLDEPANASVAVAR
ncbi:hypothetical protein [Streptomyces sp. NPDC001404]|uniref:hypothetical protein n=1 Tax=Streptomyces sp. NPDC001404 TaxID=3364571 RepID=UPI0036830E67